MGGAYSCGGGRWKGRGGWKDRVRGKDMGGREGVRGLAQHVERSPRLCPSYSFSPARCASPPLRFLILRPSV